MYFTLIAPLLHVDANAVVAGELVLVAPRQIQDNLLVAVHTFGVVDYLPLVFVQGVDRALQHKTRQYNTIQLQYNGTIQYNTTVQYNTCVWMA